MLNNERTIILRGQPFRVEIHPPQIQRADLTRLENMPREYNWIEDIDSNDNTIWLLQSPYEEGFKFRLKQRLVCNEIEWIEAHDPELMGNTAPNFWCYLSDAKWSIEECYRNILADNSV